MFEYRYDLTRAELSDLFGVPVIDRGYVIDPGAGQVLTSCGGVGRDHVGSAYVLRWRERVVGLHCYVERPDDEHGRHPLLVPRDVGHSTWATGLAGVPRVDLTAEDETAALRIASEACLVLEASRGTWGPGLRVVDPFDGDGELAPEDYGYDLRPDRLAAYTSPAAVSRRRRESRAPPAHRPK